LLGRVVICNHGDGRRATSGFAHSNANSSKGQAPKANRQAANGRHGAPSCAAIGYKIAPVGSVCKATKWDCQCAVKQGKRKPTQKSHGRIRDLKLLFDRLHENTHDLTINEAHGVDKQEQS